MIGRIFDYNNKRKSIFVLIISFISYLFIVNYLSAFLRDIFPVPLISKTSQTSVSIGFQKTCIILLIAVILEEVKYRLLFTKFNINFILISICFYLSDLVFLFFRSPEFSIYSQKVFIVILYYLGISILAFLLFFLLKGFFVQKINPIKRFFEQNFKLLIFIQILLFVLWHFFFTSQGDKSHFIVVLITQGLAATYYTFIRINYGVIYSILMHFLYNLIIFSIVSY